MSYSDAIARGLKRKRELMGETTTVKGGGSFADAIERGLQRKAEDEWIRASDIEFDDDFAPTVTVDDSEKKWYEKGLFEDGYDFGDVTKTLLGIEDKKKLKTFEAPDTTLSLEELKKKQEYYANRTWNNADQLAESLKYTQQYNQMALAQYSDTLSKTKMDGTDRTILEEIEILANMKSGKEKDERKEAVLKKMESLGMDTSFYSHFAGDGEFDWGTFAKWVGSSAMAGLNSFNKGLMDTADVILGAPLKAMGWENNPISEGAEYYGTLYESYNYDRKLLGEKLGGGAWNFGGDAVEGTFGAVPNALLLFMTGGASTTTSTSGLMNQAAMATGNVLTKAGLTIETMMKNPQFWTSFARTLGSDYKEAKEMGASDSAAAVGSVLTSMLNAGIEIGPDGGSGIQGLPDGLKGGKPLWEWVESSLEEGGEEMLQKFVGEAVAKVGYGSDKEMLNPIEYAKEGTLGVISGAFLGGGQTAVQSGVNAFNEYQADKLTVGEQAVADKIIEKRIAEKEKDGKLTAKEKSDIKEEVERNLRKGFLTAEEIEEAIGGESYETFRTAKDAFFGSETYKNYQKAVQEEDAAKKEFDTLVKIKQGDMTGEQIYRRDDLKKMLEESKVGEMKSNLENEAAKVIGLRNQMRSEMMQTVQGTRLAETYRELERSKQKFEVDVNQYKNENAKKTVESILASGLGDNSNQFHETVDWLAKLAESRNVTFDLTKTERLKGTKHYREGYVTNGFKTTVDGKTNITLNLDGKYLNTTVGHEITHVLEEAGVYQDLATAVKNFAIAKEGQEAYNARLDAIKEIYGEDQATIDSELTADIIGEYLFTDYNFVHNLSTQNRNVFQKIYDEIKYMVKIATAGSKEARELVKVQKMFDKAWKDTKGKAINEAETERTIDVENEQDLDYESPDKYSIKVEDKDTIDFLENQEHITTYKAMVLIDGKLYPPMASKVKGEDGKYHMTNGRELGEWMQAEEDTTNIKFNDKGVGYYDLKKDDGGTVRAAYNPYEHSSNLVLNDQFEAAYKRGNLVTVECVIPKSEIDNPYTAQYAKDSTGMMDWHSGTVAGKLSDNKRSVYLSRYLKVNRIVPDSEVAQKYKEIVGDLAVPFNVVSPSLLTELENAGVNIDYDGSPQYQYLQRKAAEREAKKNTQYSMSIADIKKEYKDQTDYLFIHEKRDGTISLDNMVVKKEFRNQGVGTKILNDLINYADDNGKIITLTPTSEFGTKAKLTKWYKANGFVENKGRNADYSLSDTMYRLPKPMQALEGGSVTQYSLSTWTPETQASVEENLIKAGFDKAQVEKWIQDTNSIASVIASDKARLDFEAADNQVMLKDNQEYIKTLDASTLCAKRLVYQGTFNAIQHRLPNTMLSSDDLIELLNMMKAHGVQTPCGVCYVESRRRHLGKFAQQWLDSYEGEYKPRLDEVTTSDGLEELRKTHPQAAQDFIDAMNKKGSSNPKVVQLRTEYRNDIMSLTPAQIRKIESIGGLRVQSFSDFETPHLLDMMQAVLDMSAKGLHSQAYTKVPNFAWVFGDTGIKINLSLIADGDGFDSDGNLAFSSTEGMDIDEAMRLRDAYSQNVGTIIVGANDKHILACMADDRIDFIIPFHRSGWGMTELKMMGMDSYTDYTYGQKEHDLNKPTKVVNGVQQYAGLSNLYPPDYWNYELSGKENAERYLNLCAKLGREPKFAQFLVNNGDGSYSLQPDGSTDGYWKTLIDFKMYDNSGKGAAQQKVVPNFNMTEAHRVLNEYEGGANKLPVADKVVEEFVAKHQYSITKEESAKMDADYLAAVESGDEEVQKHLVREYAKASMPDSKLVDENGNLRVVYHGTNTGDFTVFNPDYIGMSSGDDGFFGMGFYFAYSKGEASYYGARRIIPAYLNLTNPFNFEKELHSYNGKRARYGHAPDAVALMNFADKFPDIAMHITMGAIKNGESSGKRISVFEFAKAFKDIIENKEFDYQEQLNEWGETETLVTADPQVHEYEYNGETRSYRDFGFQKRFTRDADILDVAYEYLSNAVYSYIDIPRFTSVILDNNREFTAELKNRGYDGTIQSEHGDEAVAFEPSQIKSAAPITRDENGNVIPLSKRFDSSQDDIRYSISKDEGPTSGNWHISGKDFGNQDEFAEFAPVREDVSKTENVAPYTDNWQESFDAITDEDAPPAPEEESGTIESRIRQRIANTQAELDKNIQLREDHLNYYDEEIAKKQAEYDSKKNKNTLAAQSILRSIERLKRLRANSNVDYSKRISDLENRIEKMNSKDYHRAEVRRAKQVEQMEFWGDLIGDTTGWKDFALGITYKTKTLRRILRKVVRDPNGNPDFDLADTIYDELETKYDHNEAQLKMESQRLKEVFSNLKLNRYEDTYAHMMGEFRHNPETKLTEDAVNEYYQKYKNRIDTDKVETAITEARKTFDDLIVRVNEVLREQGIKEIPYRKGYFPHFTNPKQNWFQKLLNWKPIDTEIPTSIAGLTQDFKPVKSWQSFAQQRKGDTTDYSLYQGLDTYIHGALDWIYHIEDIQSRRALENYIREIHSDEGVQKRIQDIRADDSLDALEVQDAIDGVLAEANNPLSGLVRELMNRTNTLANKKSSMDRETEDMFNRKVYSTMTNLNNRINANMVVGSLSSALTNFIPMVQSWHQVSPAYTVQGLRDMIRSTIKDDGMIAKSDFLTNRLIEEEKLYKTGWDKVSDKAALLMNAVDNITSQTVWRSKYLQNLKEGMSESYAIKDADQFAKNLIAGRSRGNMPSIFDAKNPVTKLFTAFQLEVANQYGYMFEDVPQESTNKVRLVKGYATAFLGAYVYNALYSSMVGRDAAFDPIAIIQELIGDLLDDDEEPEEALAGFASNVIEEVPFVGSLVGGGRVPLSSAFPYSGDSAPFQSLMNDVESAWNEGNWTEGNWKPLAKEMLKPLYYLAMPVGGGQIKKTNEGLGMFSDDHPIAGSYTDSGRLRFPVEDTIGNRVKAAMFGQYSSQNARDYFDNGRSALTEKQLSEFMELDAPIQDYWEYRDGLKGFTKQADKLKYINGLDLTKKQKDVLKSYLFDEEGYKKDNPEKYAFFEKEGIGYLGYKQADEDTQEAWSWAYSHQDEYQFYKQNGVMPEDYSVYRVPMLDFKDESDSAVQWAFDNPEKATFGKVFSEGVREYREYATALSEIRADKDSNGKSINGSAKKKKIEYIDSLDIDYGEKLILFKNEYNADDTYNHEIIEYLDGRDDMTFEEKVSILRQLGFTVTDDGNVTW